MKSVLALFASFIMGTSSLAAESRWNLTRLTYEGFPLLLRYPVDLNYDKLQSLFPTFVVVTIPYSEYTDNGLPENNFNRTILEPLDELIFKTLGGPKNGYCVLVETFYKNRHYYLYVAPSFDVELLKKTLQSSDVNLAIEVEKSHDPSWSFIRRYAKESFK